MCELMDKRKMKRELKQYLVSEIFLVPNFKSRFILLKGLRTKASLERLDRVIMDLYQEWSN